MSFRISLQIYKILIIVYTEVLCKFATKSQSTASWEGKIKAMRELFIKYFGRILAILGCSTMVTACYGVPETPYEVKGRVVDAESGKPIKNIKVSVSAGSGYGTTGAVGSIYENEGSYPMSTYTSADGEFDVTLYEYFGPDAFLVECTDVDGLDNGLYEPLKEAVPIEKSQDFVVKMTPKN